MSSMDNVGTTTAGGGGSCECTPRNILNCNGILKIVEILFSLIVIICVTQDKYFLKEGGPWVIFVAGTATLCLIIMFIIYLLNIIARLPRWWCLVEFIFYTLFTVLYVTCSIVCAAADHDPKIQPALDAAVVFSFLAVIIFHVDTFMKYHEHRLSREDN